MEYRYIARDLSGKEVEGRIEASAPSDVAKILREKGLFPISIEPVKRFSLKFDFQFGRVRLKEVVLFTRQLTAMIGAGIPLPSAIGALSQQMKNKKFKQILEDVREQVETGVKFSEALRKYEKVFGRLYISLVEAGEATGELDLMLERWATFAEKILELRRKVVGAMIYPIVVLTFAVGIMLVLLVKVVPTFAEMFRESNVELPALTAFIIALSDFVKAHVMFMILGAVVFVVGFRMLLRMEKFRYYWDAFKLRIPLVGPLFRKVAMARFARTLATMIKSGVSILESIDNVAKTSGNKVIEEALMTIKNEVAEGALLSEALSKTEIFPPMLVEMVSAGERTGNLDTMLDKIADFFEEEVDAAVNALTSVMEPIMLIVIGGMVGVIVIALYLPIFKLASTIK